MNNSAYYTVLAAFALAVYFIVTDENAARMVSLRFSWFWVNVRRRWFILTMAPRLHYDMWRMKQEVKRIRKEHGLPND